MRYCLITIFAYDQILPILNIATQDRLRAESTNRSFLATGGAHHFATHRCKLIRGHIAPTATGSTLITLSADEQAPVRCFVSKVTVHDWLMTEVANLCFLLTGRAHHFASYRGELLRGNVAQAATWNGTITTLTYNQPVTVCIVSTLQPFSA